MGREATVSKNELYPSLFADQVLPEIAISAGLKNNRKRFSEEPMPRIGKPLDHRTLKVVYVGIGPNAAMLLLRVEGEQTPKFC